jgi:flagellar hook-associated protein 3 FlgL
MSLQITPQVLVNQIVNSANEAFSQLAQLQSEASSGLRIQNPSDDPVGAVAAMASNAQDLQLTTYLSNLQGAQTQLNSGVSALQQAESILSQAKQIAIQGSNAGNDSNSLATLAQQLNDLIGQMVNVANTQQGTQYLFGGAATASAPFKIGASDAQGNTESVAYQGAEGQSEALIGPQQAVATTYDGSQIFQSRQRGQTVFDGSTGAGPGTGTDSATGEGTLLVAHTTTIYAGGSGVQPGTSSVAGDTIIGLAGAHFLTIQAAGAEGQPGTISLDGGTPIALSANPDLEVSGPNGQVVYVDTTGIDPSFSGNVQITANGTLSVDGGKSAVPIDFSGNQVVTNSTTGAVTNVDSSSIVATGSTQLDYSGTYDVFQIMIALRDDLNNTQGLSDSQLSNVISGHLADLAQATSGVTQGLGMLSANAQNLQSVQQRLQLVQLSTQQRTSDLQSADISSVVVGLQEEQNLYSLTLDSASKILSESLLNFLQ